MPVMSQTVAAKRNHCQGQKCHGLTSVTNTPVPIKQWPQATIPLLDHIGMHAPRKQGT